MFAAVIFLACFAAVVCGFEVTNSTNEFDSKMDNIRRNLQANTELSSKKVKNKVTRAQKLLEIIDSKPTPDYFVKTPSSPAHNPDGPAIFTVAMGEYLKYVHTHRKHPMTPLLPSILSLGTML